MRTSRAAGQIIGRPTGAPGRRADPAWWPVGCVLVLIVSSDFQFRLRADDQAVSGNADLFVALEVAVYGAVAAFLFTRFRPRPRLRRANRLTYLGYAYACVLIGSALYSPYYQLALVRAGQVLVIVALFSSIVRHTDRAAPHRIAHGYALLVAGSVLFGVLVPFPRLDSQPDRFTWLHVHPVQAGEMLAIAVVLLTAYLATTGLPRHGPSWPAPVYLGLLAVCVGGLVATKTRGAVLGAVVGVVIVLLVRWRGTRLAEIGLLGGCLAAVVALSGSSVIAEYFTRGESSEQLATLNSRTELWAAAVDEVARHPLYGSGLAASRGLFLERIGLGGGHNALVNVVVDTGLVGALVWLALLVGIIAAAIRLASGRPAVLHLSGPGALEGRSSHSSATTMAARTDGTIVIAVLGGMIVNSVFTEELGAPANMAFTWLYVLLAWVLLASTPDTRPEERR